jgi:hypothetical protein
MNVELEKLISELEKISDDARATFGNLSAEQINWKPDAKSWSVGQCFDHLIVTNESEFPEIEKVIKGEHKNPFWGKVPFLTDFWGRFVLKAVEPENTKKTKNPKVFSPSASEVDANIINRFIEHQQKTIELMKATKDLDLTKIIIPSPVASFVTYRLSDTYKIVVQHEKRHFKQAERVMQASGFPHSESAL